MCSNQDTSSVLQPSAQTAIWRTIFHQKPTGLTHSESCWEEQGRCRWCTVQRHHAPSFLFSWVTIQHHEDAPHRGAGSTATASLIGKEQTGPKSQDGVLQCIRYSSHSGYDLAKCYFGLAVCCLDCSSLLQHCLLLILLLHLYFRQPNLELWWFQSGKRVTLNICTWHIILLNLYGSFLFRKTCVLPVSLWQYLNMS